MGDVTPILIQAMDRSNPVAANEAEAQINAARDANFAGFIVALMNEFRDETKPDQSRQLALLLLKNSVAFNSSQETKKQELEAKWRTIAAETRTQVKTETLNTLASANKSVRQIAALVIANLARIELPHDQWPDLLQVLVAACGSDNDQHMEAALTTVGYICEETASSDGLADFLQQHSNSLLTAICNGMRRPNEEVRFYATKALRNAMDFVERNMTVKEERAYLFGVVLDNTKVDSERTREMAMKCLVEIAERYYANLTDYMQAIFNLTLEAVNKDSESVGIPAIEFWIAICDTEIEILDGTHSAPLQSYIKGAKQFLVDMLLGCLQKQQEGQTDDDWNISTAAALCLQRTAQAIGDDVVPLVMPFVFSNINSNDWRLREAACMAFGCILVGPEPQALQDTVAQAVPGLLQYIKEGHPLVRDTAIWTLAIVALHFTKAMLQPSLLPNVFNTIGPLLRDTPQMAARTCTVLYNMCLYYEDEDEEEEEQPLSNELSPYFSDILAALIATMDRQDANDCNLRAQAQETLNVLIGAAASDVIPTLRETIPTMVQRLHGSLTMQSVSAAEQHSISQLQGLACGSLHHIIRKLGPQAVEFQKMLMEALIGVFSANKSNVHEEGLMAVGTLSAAVGPSFAEYMPLFCPYLITGLRTIDEYHVCNISVGCVGDLFAALKEAIGPWCDDIVGTFITNLNNPDLDNDLRIAMMAAFGDIAINIRGHFEKYLQAVMQIVESTHQRVLNSNYNNSDEEREDAMDMWEAIGNAYTGILQSQKQNPVTLIPYLQNAVNFCCVASRATRNYEDVFRTVVGVIGDIANVSCQFDAQHIASAKSIVLVQAVYDVVVEALRSSAEETKESATWVKKQMELLEAST